MSQFAFLSAEFAEVHEFAMQAEMSAHADPRTACFYARLALETAVKWLYRHDGSLKNPYETTLSAHIHEPSFKALAGDRLVAKARVIKELGNTAAHGRSAVPFQKAVTSLRELFHFSYWLARSYAKGAKPGVALAFSADALTRTTSVSTKTLAQLEEIARRFAETVKARADAEAKRLASEEDRAKLETELAALHAEIAKVKAANAALPDIHDYSESETRDAFIDILLSEAGWVFSNPGQDTEFQVTGMPNAKGEGFVDYVLWGDDGKPLGLVEAKRTRKDARTGQQQAKLYADCLEATFGQRPIIFYSNGYDHWIWDDHRYPPRPVQGFLTKDELELAIRRRTTLKPLNAAGIDPKIVERFYQTRAIRRVAEAFEKDRLRRALLVMATGTGKTRTVIALADLLMRANWARRVLFLADRVALVNQAVNAFKTHLRAASPVNLVTEKEATGRVYVSTYPTMMSLIDETTDGKRRFGPGHFDLIVIDEAHRSVYRKYGSIFDYFDSLLVGLTATPKEEVDHNTYGLFDLQRGVPTDAYDLEEAVRDGFLVPPRAVALTTDFMERGINYDNLSEEEKEDWDAIEWDEDGTVPRVVEPPAINKWLFNKDTVDKVLEHLMTSGLKVADGDRIGKTIIFAKNQDHARFIVERFDKSYPHLVGSFCRLIVSSESYAQSLIDAFGQTDKPPHIAVSVDMLDTGIDVPEVLNLVFFKAVRSKTKFWQMIGRGTRLCPHIFGPGRHKEHFLVFDWCRNFEFFNQNRNAIEPVSGESLSKRLFVTRVELIAELDKLMGVGEGEPGDGDFPQPPPLVLHAGEPSSPADLEVQNRKLREELAAVLRDEIQGMSPDNFIVRPKRLFVERYGDESAWNSLGLDARAELVQQVAGLPSSVIDDDIAAKQFDILILKSQLALLRSDPAIASLREKIVALGSALEELGNVPMVAREFSLIQEIQSDDFWENVTCPGLESARRRLRGLIKLIELRRRPVVYSDFVDEARVGAAVVLPGLGTVGLESFRMRARQFLKGHESHIAVLKLRRNEPLTPTDLSELERIFAESGADPSEIEKVRKEGGFGLFVRSLVGMDREAAKRAFDSFMLGKALTGNQIEFLNLVIDYLTERGTMDPKLLYESPFTDFDPLGVEGVFDRDQASVVIGLLRDVNARAAA
ncbi:MAG: DEAD/DEAH box helicase family protein [Hyphomicrobiales bacterium]|nr:DEAD/DEAH box helicase family protein [Hyphomicrobiales bacterium]